MTALTQYQRLESPGLWREAPEAQRRDVIVTFGDNSLVISDLRETALAHWSLAAVERLNPGTRPALYSPGEDAVETLEIDDETMIEAVEKVRAAVARGRPRRGRLRGLLLTASLAGVAALAAFWLPGALVRQTVSVVPAGVRAEIGGEVLRRMGRVAGQPCATSRDSTALRRLAARLAPGGGLRLAVLPGGTARAVALPGGLIALNRALVEDYEDANVLAGFIVVAAARADQEDPLARLLREAGVMATLRLLTSGALPETTLADHAERLLTAPQAPLPDARLLAAFAAAELPSTPYAFARDVSGETVLGLIEADPMRGRTAPPVLSDSDWVRLQGTCAR
ncbi:hypothetical protein Ga0609869_003360 [Rhodovulum iodosum]|uniref:Uncharacterized protein n=1 Tax=Rhodovulum iodosum TaxID=68291 RepID=A0ABV3XXB8_9RHOB|nr:hypothetical protein [Rhodovulum robiginosum]RSK37822.1 hypothetical protein EJA01_04060 [Rhodovulum robiginosum]